MIYHLAEPAHWAQALRSGSYTQSTRGMSLEQVGFVHCADADQVEGVLQRFYADAGELVLLDVDPDLLTSPLVYEVGNPATGEQFPHVYGPLDVAAVVATRVLTPPHTPHTLPNLH